MAAGEEITLTLSDGVDDDVRDLIGEGLDDDNIERAGPYRREELWIVGRDAAGAVLGGLKGQVDYDWLMVDWLWCSRSWRRRGLGSRLMGEAERFAAGRGCRGVYVQTATYQAPDFYRRLGYVEFGRLDELLPGHAMIWLRKLVEPSPGP